jgi:hypothetical protein
MINIIMASVTTINIDTNTNTLTTNAITATTKKWLLKD